MTSGTGVFRLTDLGMRLIIMIKMIMLNIVLLIILNKHTNKQ